MMLRKRLIYFKMSIKSDMIFILINISVCLFVIVNGQKCEENSPSYLFNSISIVCKNLYQKFPSFEKSVSNMKCYECNIPIVEENTIIKNFKGDVFNLSYSHVQKINSLAFRSFTNSTHKFLFENNEIMYVAPKLFSNFSLLDDVNFRKNKISKLDYKAFEGTNLSTLDLSQNSLTDISHVFEGLKVTKLNLSSNQIVKIAQDTFDKTTFWTGRQWRAGLQQIDLSNNLLENIVPDTFKSSSSDNIIRSLHLNANQISVIENNTFSKLSYLKFLSLEKNQLSELYTDSFRGLTSLNTLILKNNYLKQIPSGMFADLRQLEMLDLSINSLTTLSMNTFSGLTYLTKLNISHNNLRTLDETHILPLGRLISLDISDTKLKDLNLQSILEHHYKLRVLVINDNFWNCKHLVQMYKQMNERIGGFDYPSKHFDVPNLHGIACSRMELDSYDTMNFEDFLTAISQDNIFEDLYDNRVHSEALDISIDDIKGAIRNIQSIYYVLVIIVTIVLMLFIQFIIRLLIRFMYNRKIITNDKFSFAYVPNQDNVELL